MIYTNISILLTQTVLHSAVLFPLLLGEPAPLPSVGEPGPCGSRTLCWAAGCDPGRTGSKPLCTTTPTMHRVVLHRASSFIFPKNKCNINPNQGTHERRRSTNAVAGLGRRWGQSFFAGHMFTTAVPVQHGWFSPRSFRHTVVWW